MSDAPSAPAATPAGPLSRKRGTAVLVLADGTVFEGHGFGAATSAVGEVCFNTAMTGYQEILTDPSYAGQIVAFTFPHVGIVGTNAEDVESTTPVVRAMVVRADAQEPSNYRNMEALDRWLALKNIPGIAGLDTRALTARIREQGMPHGIVAHDPNGKFDIDALVKQAREFPGLVGLDLARDVTCRQMYRWTETPWKWSEGFGEQTAPSWRAVVLDYGVKRNILRELAGLGAEIIVLPASASFDDVMRHSPNGVLLSNGPGDPASDRRLCDPDHQGAGR